MKEVASRPGSRATARRPSRKRPRGRRISGAICRCGRRRTRFGAAFVRRNFGLLVDFLLFLAADVSAPAPPRKERPPRHGVRRKTFTVAPPGTRPRPCPQVGQCGAGASASSLHVLPWRHEVARLAPPVKPSLEQAAYTYVTHVCRNSFQFWGKGRSKRKTLRPRLRLIPINGDQEFWTITSWSFLWSPRFQ